MIQITAQTANEAWLKTLKVLFNEGENTNNQKYLRDEVALVEIKNPQVEPAHPSFPMSQQDLDIINNYIVSGKNEEAVVHEWTKIYYHRTFDAPHSQIEYLVSKLDSEDPRGEAQISIWDKNIDQEATIHPCTQIIWARIKHGRLEMHVHANSSDAYKKLLMNLLEFIALQHYIAAKINIPVGSYYHFLDSCHLYTRDEGALNKLVVNL